LAVRLEIVVGEIMPGPANFQQCEMIVVAVVCAVVDPDQAVQVALETAQPGSEFTSRAVFHGPFVRIIRRGQSFHRARAREIIEDRVRIVLAGSRLILAASLMFMAMPSFLGPR
jgi:hypothetical protein